MTHVLRPGVDRFPDAEAGCPRAAGCRKVRRGDGTRRPDDGSPSPPSGSRRLTKVIAPPGGTLRAGWRAKGASVLATRRRAGAPLPRGPRKPAEAGAGRAAGRLPARGEALGAVDRGRPSDIVDESKKVVIPRGLQVFYQSWTASSRAAPARLEGPAGAARPIRCAGPLTGARRDRFGASSRKLRGCAASGEVERSVMSEALATRSGTSLAALAGRGAVPRGSGRGAGRRRHERVRFGVGQAWVRARRDAAHLRHGRAGA